MSYDNFDFIDNFYSCENLGLSTKRFWEIFENGKFENVR